MSGSRAGIEPRMSDRDTAIGCGTVLRPAAGRQPPATGFLATDVGALWILGLPAIARQHGLAFFLGVPTRRSAERQLR